MLTTSLILENINLMLASQRKEAPEPGEAAAAGGVLILLGEGGSGHC